MAKKIPNPNGRKGGKPHQDLVKKIEQDAKRTNKTFRLEFRVILPNGRSRYVDIAVFGKNNRVEELHQVGKQNKNGTPIARERRAIEDIGKVYRITMNFHAYNLCVLFILSLILYFYL